jgi:hypothetical protein
MGGLGMSRRNKTGAFMKKNLVVLSFVVVFGMMAAFAFAGENMRINVPFAFYMGDQQYPAGEYNFNMNHGNYATGSVVNIWAPKGTEDKLVMANAGTDFTTTANELVFKKYGQKLFLSTVSINGYKATLKVLNLEKELRGQVQQAPSAITVAQK